MPRLKQVSTNFRASVETTGKRPAHNSVRLVPGTGWTLSKLVDTLQAGFPTLAVKTGNRASIANLVFTSIQYTRSQQRTKVLTHSDPVIVHMLLKRKWVPRHTRLQVANAALHTADGVGIPCTLTLSSLKHCLRLFSLVFHTLLTLVKAVLFLCGSFFFFTSIHRHLLQPALTVSWERQFIWPRYM